MDDPTIIERRGCCVPKKLDEETMSLLRENMHKYGPVMEPVPPKRYKFKRTLKCSPAEMKRIEEAKRQRLAQEAEEAATGIKRPHLIAYSSHTKNVDPNCDGLLPVDLSLPLVSDVPPTSWQRYLDTYQQRRAAAVAALEARAAAAAARPPRPRLFIDPQMKLMLCREHEAALAAAAATGTKVQAECVGGAGLKRPCDDSNSGTSETHADSDLFVADYSSLEVPSPKLVHEDPNPTTASVTEGQAECAGSGVKRPRDDLNPVAADYSSPTAVPLREWIGPLTKLMRYRESAAATVTEGQSEREGSVLKRPRSDTNPGATDPGFEFKVMNFLVAIPSP